MPPNLSTEDSPVEKRTAEHPSAEDRNAEHASADERGALRADFQRYLDTMSGIHGPRRARVAAAAEFGFIAVAVYRFGRLARRLRPRWLGFILKAFYRVANFFVEILFGISISTNSRIGRGFYIGHFGGIVVHGDLGEGCSIGQGVTIGSRGAGRSDGYPDIGKRVYLGAGSMVVGRVHVGDDVVVGANTVVVSDVAAGCRVVSAPARILPPRTGASAGFQGRSMPGTDH